MTKKSKKTRKLKLTEHRELMAFLRSRGINEAARECRVSSAVISRMRDRRGKARLSTIERVFSAVREAQKKSVATQPSVPAINGAPRDFTRILADFEKAEGPAALRPDSLRRAVYKEMRSLDSEICETEDDDTRERLMGKWWSIRNDHAAYVKSIPIQPAVNHAEYWSIEPAKPAVDHSPEPEDKSDSHNPLDFIEAWDLNFNLGNAVKHIVMGTKVDLEKAALYLKRELGRRSS